MTSGMLARVVRTVRASDWWAYKIPPLLATAYAGFLAFGTDGWRSVCLTLAAILLIAVYGYIQNDICDLEADRASGRPNRMEAVGAGGRLLWMGVPAVGAIALVARVGDPVLNGIVIANLIVPALYSVPPIRLKGRRLAGALADAVGVHALPMALVARAVSIEAHTPTAAVFVGSAVAWSTLAGFRGILTHQIIDGPADAAAGVVTFGRTLGEARARWLVTRLLLPCEAVAVTIFLANAARDAPVIWITMAVWAVAELVKIARHWTMPMFRADEHSPERYVPLANNELYEMWLPMAALLQLALRQPAWWLIVGVHVVLFYPNLRVRSAVALRVLERTR